MKTKPYGVRFDEDLLKKIKKKEKLTSPQQVVNYLMKWYEQVHFGIPVNVTGARPAISVTPADIKKQSEEGKGIAPVPPVKVQNLTSDKNTNISIDTRPKGTIDKVVTDLRKLSDYNKLLPTLSTKPALEALRDEILEHPALTPSSKQDLIPRIESKMKFLK